MMATRWAGPVAGLGFAVAVILEAVAFPGGPSSSDPAAVIARYYQQHGTTDLVVDHLSLVAVPLLLLFLCSRTGRLTGTAARFAQCAAVAGAAFELVATAIEMTLAAAVGRFALATTTAALYDVASRMFFVSLLWLGLAVGSIAAADLAWQRWLGLATGVLLVGAGLGIAHPHGTLGVLVLPAESLLVVWVVVTAVGQLRGGRPATVEQRPAVAA